ncbi:hypothetical protein [Aphanothece stagnina]
MDHLSFVSRSWNGTPTSRRFTNGDVTAPAMCKANKNRWSDYRESYRCQQNIDGAPRQVKSYHRSWLIDTLKRCRAPVAGG